MTHPEISYLCRSVKICGPKLPHRPPSMAQGSPFNFNISENMQACWPFSMR